jgi:phage terminase small subunit
MARDERRQKLIANLIIGMKKPEAARAAGYSDSFARVNVYALLKSADFQQELAQARSASDSTSPVTRQSASDCSLAPSQSGNPQTAEIAPLSPTDGLTLKERLFRDYYLGEARGNGTLAARLAGYEGDDNSLGVMAYHLLRKPKIQTSIQQALDTVTMGAHEVLETLSKQARGTLADVLDDNGRFNLQLAKERGTIGLLRKMKVRRRIERRENVETEYIDHDLEIHNAQTALEMLGRHHRLFGDTSGETETRETVERYELIVILQGALDAGLDDNTPGRQCIDVTPESAASHLLDSPNHVGHHAMIGQDANQI